MTRLEHGTPQGLLSRSKPRLNERGSWQAYLFIAPALLLYALFTLLPIVQTSLLSVGATSTTGSPPGIGLDYYRSLTNDQIFWRALRHTFLWLGMHVVFAGGFGLITAVLVSQAKLFRIFFRTGFFLPHIVSLAVVGVIWGMIYDPFFGLLNNTLDLLNLGLLKHNWLGDPNLVLPAINIASSWQAYGLYMLLYLAGLQNIDTQLYDAAAVDGANWWRKLWHVTLPGLREVHALVLSLAMINSLKGFASVWVMTQGGPFYSSELIATYIYKLAFNFQNHGRSAALSMVLAFLAIAITVAFNRWQEARS